MKTLLVQFTGRGERSNTKKLADHFLSQVEDVEVLDLTKTVPDMFVKENLMVYYKRNYGGEQLENSETKLLAKMDSMTKQFKEADVVAMAFPMYNFSLPAIVKAYFDSVMLKGETWDMGANGFIGLMKGKKALILTTSGGKYEGSTKGYDFVHPLAEAEFTFMGFSDVKTVTAGGLNMHPEETPKTLEEAKQKISSIVKDWY